MAGLINVIGVVSGLLGIYQFGADNFGSSEDTGGSVVRIQVGLDSTNGLSNAGGDLPDIRLFNEVGEFLGASYDPGSIEDGTTGTDIRVQQTAEQQAAYALFSANDNAICIAYLSIVWPDEQKFGWTGDWGKECGATWYYSNIALAGQADKPACMWIDANHDQPVTAFQLHFAEFVTTDGQFPHDRAYYCQNGPPFKLYYTDDPNMIDYWVPNQRRTNSKRTPGVSNAIASQPVHLKRQTETIYSTDSRLVISGDIKQSSAELCTSAVSLGPDFLNTADGHFCQMRTKTLYPVCSDTVTDNCFNSITQKLVINGVSTRDVEYSKVIDWSSGSP